MNKYTQTAPIILTLVYFEYGDYCNSDIKIAELL